ncbi:uncharacterized protein LACBIDRAFT_297897 [Laccaria bicolor S238N-H82]|uniref:Predicted protein n=1 Tax=Laccaria bicolor (strain S238N-H82 / ATCC MYA-4686) TaxID=486041 RepID=B0DB57_LACBS|nr:uncharacterized protein LACBIDRAFT_297897 [Laccaria bicolor S238N-H82]EDR08331.1 predicted protein [Laccaria bicolor S238N-H82]|eukprot:XP_001881401.1 predicted protein [Laccaria bicolor S238N-H82]
MRHYYPAPSKRVCAKTLHQTDLDCFEASKRSPQNSTFSFPYGSQCGRICLFTSTQRTFGLGLLKVSPLRYRW